MKFEYWMWKICNHVKNSKKWTRISITNMISKNSQNTIWIVMKSQKIGAQKKYASKSKNTTNELEWKYIQYLQIYRVPWRNNDKNVSETLYIHCPKRQQTSMNVCEYTFENVLGCVCVFMWGCTCTFCVYMWMCTVTKNKKTAPKCGEKKQHQRWCLKRSKS